MVFSTHTVLEDGPRVNVFLNIGGGGGALSVGTCISISNSIFYFTTGACNREEACELNSIRGKQLKYAEKNMRAASCSRPSNNI